MLLEAVMRGDLGSVQRILESGDESFKLSHASCTCLAVRKKYRDIVVLLLEHGFDVNHRDAQGHSPLYYSVEGDDADTTELLLQRGAVPDDTNELLHFAARKGFKNVVEVLVDFGADVNAKDDCDQTALHHAILSDSALSTFTEDYPVVDIRAMESVVSFLLDKGSDVNARTARGQSALHFAILFRYAGVVSILLDRGADVHSQVDLDFESPYKIYPFVRLRSANNRIPYLTSLLHLVLEANDPVILEMVVRAGASLDCVAYDGTTTLITAVQRQNVLFVRKLLDSGADLEKQDVEGKTALHRACSRGSVDVMIPLINAGANVNAVCKCGKVPYQYCLHLEEEEAYFSGFAHNYCDQLTTIVNTCLVMRTILQRIFIIMFIYGLDLHVFNKKIAMKKPISYHRALKKEIDEFSKTVTVCNNIRLYSVFNEIKNPTYVRNPNVSTGLEQAIVVTNEKYPGFGNVVNLLVQNARIRVNLLDRGIEWFVQLNRKFNQLPTLPFDVLEIVFSCLLNEEIQNFITCCEGL